MASSFSTFLPKRFSGLKQSVFQSMQKRCFSVDEQIAKAASMIPIADVAEKRYHVIPVNRYHISLSIAVAVSKKYWSVEVIEHLKKGYESHIITTPSGWISTERKTSSNTVITRRKSTLKRWTVYWVVGRRGSWFWLRPLRRPKPVKERPQPALGWVMGWIVFDIIRCFRLWIWFILPHQSRSLQWQQQLTITKNPKQASSPTNCPFRVFVNPPLDQCLAWKEGQQVVVTLKLFLWTISIFISPGISMRLLLHTVFFLLWSTTTFIGV